MQLCELLSDLKVEIAGPRDVEIRGVTECAERAEGGIAFFAVLGEKNDGHAFIPEAHKRGSRVFFVSRKTEEIKGSTYVYCSDTREMLGIMLSKIYKIKEKSIKIVAITGTKGKTTIAEYIAKCLLDFGKSALVIGTLGVRIGNKILEFGRNTTPRAERIYSALAEAEALGVEYAIIEVSSQALKHKRIFGLELFAVVFSNLSRDHIGEFEHRDFFDYFLAKESLFSEYRSEYAIVNAKDKLSYEISYRHPKVISVFPRQSAERRRFILFDKVLDSPSDVHYEVENAALAITAAALLLGKCVSDFRHSLSQARVEGRFNIYERSAALAIIDFAHNAASFAEVIPRARRLASGRLFVLFGSVGDRSYSRRRELAEVAERLADFSYITEDNSASEPPLKICEEILSHFRDKRRARIIVDRAEAIGTAIAELCPGDVLLLLGKGHENTIERACQDFHFSEREILIDAGFSEKH